MDNNRVMDEVEKKKNMCDEIIELNKQVSHLLHEFDGFIFKDGKSTPIYETGAWQLQLKKIMHDHYLKK